MPATGPVYQPTTVSYETRPGLLAQTVAASPLHVLRRPIPQVILLVSSLLLVAAGVAMIVNGAADYEDNEVHRPELEIKETTETVDVCVIVGGVVLTVLGFFGLAIYVKVAEWRRSYVCPCGLSKKQGLARSLQGGGSASGMNGTVGGGQILALNPSTDPLVSHTQYAPVSELPRPEDEECRNLMLDNKECLSSAEESDRMLDSDPRIVLRPIGHVEDA